MSSGSTADTGPIPLIDPEGVDALPTREGGAHAARTERTRRDFAPAITAVVAIVVAALTITIVNVVEPNPFRARATDWWYVAGIALTVLIVAFGVWAPAAVRRYAPNLGLVAFAAWVSGFFTAQTSGSPFAYSGLIGDVGRMSALSTRFTVTWKSADPFVPNRPSEYPPLFPWLVGRTAVLTDTPAWKLLAPACALGLAVAFVASWLLWRRLVGDLAGLVVAVVAVTASGANPRKPFEVIALAIIVPWIISTFMRIKRSEGGLHWFAAGVIGGVMLSLYQAYLLFLAPAIIVLIVWQFMTKPRLEYLRHLVLTGVTAFVVASWYLIPWAWALHTQANEQVSDEYLTSTLKGNRYYLPWREPNFVFLLIVIGAFCILWNVTRTKWAPALLAIVLSAYAFRIGASLRFNTTGHTLFFQYTDLPIRAALGAGAVLGIREELMRGARVARVRWTPILVALSLVAVFGSTIHDYSVGANVLARAAHGEPLPSGLPTKYASNVVPIPGFPALQAIDAINEQYGDYALPIALSDSERIYAYYPIYAYASRDRTASSSLQDWDAKAAQVQRLTTIKDPAAFADASAHTPYGPIDVFILHGRNPMTWNALRFDRDQFGSRWFTRVLLDDNYTMYMRKGAVVDHHRYPR